MGKYNCCQQRCYEDCFFIGGGKGGKGFGGYYGGGIGGYYGGKGGKGGKGGFYYDFEECEIVCDDYKEPHMPNYKPPAYPSKGCDSSAYCKYNCCQQRCYEDCFFIGGSKGGKGGKGFGGYYGGIIGGYYGGKRKRRQGWFRIRNM